MKAKKILSLILSLLLVGSLLTACGSSGNPGSAAEPDNSADTAADGENAAPEAEAEDASPEAGTEDDELAAIQAAGKFIVGVEGTYPPFTYHDENGDLTGYDVELAKAVAEKLGVEVEFVESDWDSLLAGVDSGRLDSVINDVSYTEERAEKYDFSTPYLYIGQQVVVKAGNDSIQSLEDLDGKTIATNITNAYITELEELGATVIGIETSDEAATLVLSGRADFCMFSPMILKDYLDQHPDAELEVAFRVEDGVEIIAIPVRKGETRLLEAINQALAELSEDGTLVALSEKYFDGDYTQEP